MRAALAAGVVMDSFVAHKEDDAFLKHLPEELQSKVKDKLLPPEDVGNNITPRQYMDLMKELILAYRDNDRVDVWFGPPGPQWVSDELMVEMAQTAQELDTQIQTHALESYSEKLLGSQCYGKKSVIQHMQDLGVLGPRLSIAHGVWLTRDDLAMMKAAGAAVSHNPSSNLRLRAGVAPLNAMMQAGVTVGLGMDGTALGDDEDMFAEMRLAARLHRTPQFHSPAPTLEDIFGLATNGGATLLGKANRLGVLEPGFQADVVLVNAERLKRPWMAPEANPLHVLMQRAKAGFDVDTVFVGGEMVLQNGQPTKFDMAAVEQDLASQLAAQSLDTTSGELVAEIQPFLIEWYAQWKQPKLEPYAAFNSQT